MAALEVFLIVVLGVSAAVGIPKLWTSTRTPLALWIAGWMSAAISGLLVLLQNELRWLDLLTYSLGSLFPWLVLAGTLAWLDRPATQPLVGVALAVGALRTGLAIASGPRAAYLLALIL